MKDQGILELNSKSVVVSRKLTSAESVAMKHQKEAERRAAFNQRGRDLFASAGQDLQKGTKGLLSLLTLGTSIRSAPFVAFGSAARLSVLPVAKAAAGVLAYSKVSRLKAFSAGVSTAVILGTAGLIDMVDSSPYLALMATPDMMQEACTISPGALSSTANAAYATNDSLFKGNNGELTKSVMLHGSQHGVPAIALHYISYLETGKFRDVVANNSSADGFFQMTDQTKFDYLKAYGQKTFIYMNAKNNPQASDQDKLLVDAIDKVVATPQQDLITALKTQTLDPVLHQALKLASDPYMQAELVALDMVKNAPDLTKTDLSNEKILELTQSYYAEHHFLGMTNYRDLEKLAHNHPDQTIGNDFKSIVKANPGLLRADMTAGQAIDSIKASFAAYVEKPYTAFAKTYDVNVSEGQICLTEEAKAFLPDKISLGKAALMQSGLYPEYMQAQAILAATYTKVDGLKDQYTTATVETSFGDAVDSALKEAILSDNALTQSLRPKQRPEHKENIVSVTKSPRPMPRPSLDKS